jgi:hypothetical protein
MKFDHNLVSIECDFRRSDPFNLLWYGNETDFYSYPRLMQDLRAELAAMVDEAEWEWLIPHVQRDAVVMVNSDLDLVDVGVAIANDNVLTVQRWISEQLIYKPTSDQLSALGSDRTRRFNALIVQPYVLVQELGDK